MSGRMTRSRAQDKEAGGREEGEEEEHSAGHGSEGKEAGGEGREGSEKRESAGRRTRLRSRSGRRILPGRREGEEEEERGRVGEIAAVQDTPDGSISTKRREEASASTGSAAAKRGRETVTGGDVESSKVNAESSSNDWEGRFRCTFCAALSGTPPARLPPLAAPAGGPSLTVAALEELLASARELPCRWER